MGRGWKLKLPNTLESLSEKDTRRALAVLGGGGWGGWRGRGGSETGETSTVFMCHPSNLFDLKKKKLSGHHPVREKTMVQNDRFLLDEEQGAGGRLGKKEGGYATSSTFCSGFGVKLAFEGRKSFGVKL